MLFNYILNSWIDTANNSNASNLVYIHRGSFAHIFFIHKNKVSLVILNNLGRLFDFNNFHTEKSMLSKYTFFD